MQNARARGLRWPSGDNQRDPHVSPHTPTPRPRRRLDLRQDAHGGAGLGKVVRRTDKMIRLGNALFVLRRAAQELAAFVEMRSMAAVAE